jgi:hypothetical protein
MLYEFKIRKPAISVATIDAIFIEPTNFVLTIRGEAFELRMLDVESNEWCIGSLAAVETISVFDVANVVVEAFRLDSDAGCGVRLATVQAISILNVAPVTVKALRLDSASRARWLLELKSSLSGLLYKLSAGER